MELISLDFMTFLHILVFGVLGASKNKLEKPFQIFGKAKLKRTQKGGLSDVGNFNNFVGFRTTRGRNLYTIALLFADQCSCKRRSNRKSALLNVALIFTNDLIPGFFICIFVGEQYSRAKLYLTSGN